VSGAGSTDERLPRLLALLPWLRTRPGVRVAEAAAVFGVTERVLRDDLDLLWCCGLPGGSPGDLIDFAFEGDTVTVVDPQTLDRPLRLTADEAVALLVAARALADVPGLSERAALDRAVVKLEAAAGAAAPAAGAATVALEPQGTTLGTLREGIVQRRRLHLSYLVEARDELTERDVDPLRIALLSGRFYLEGYCYRAEAVRLFRIDRVATVTVLDVAADPPRQAVPRDLADGLFQPGPGDLLVELEVDAAARWVADYYPCESVVDTDGGGAVIRLRTPDTRWVRSLALRLGSHARIREPGALAEEVRAAAEQALAAYQH
jgi:predicted DNA-binding transcriptional regulator YafY